MLANFKHKRTLFANILVLIVPTLVALGPLSLGMVNVAAADRQYPNLQVVDAFDPESTTQLVEPDDILSDIIEPDSGQPMEEPMEEGSVATTASYPTADNQLRIYLPSVAAVPYFFVHEPVDDQGIGAESVEVASGGTSYYVDCANGHDTNSGLGKASAWKSITKANAAPLRPGDKLLLKRGCAWMGPLMASWNGTATQPITIAAYGIGNLPKIQDSYNRNVAISGSYQVIKNLEATQSQPVNPDPNCNNQSVAWKAGFSFDSGAHHNTLRDSRATKNAIGVRTDYDTHHNRIVHNTIVNNTMVWVLTSSATLGAMGILLHGDYNEVGHNYFSNNKSVCTYTGITESTSVALYGARYSNIHHNTAINDRVFSEIGGGTVRPSSDNTFAYNLHVVSFSDPSGARFIVTRWEGHKQGPVYRTAVYNNTVYFAPENSKAITCQFCDSDILIVKNNILWANREPISADGPFVEQRNLFWSNDGEPLLHFTKNNDSVIANPQFLDASRRDFRLKSSSSAIDRASLAVFNLGYKNDLVGTDLWLGAAPDSGSYEH